MNFFLELKNRLILVLFSVLFTTLSATIYKEFLLYSITLPIIKSQNDITNIYFIYTNLTDIFDAYLKMFILIGFQSSIVVSSYQIFGFLTPALYKVEYQILKRFLIIHLFSIVLPHILLCRMIIPLTLIFFENLKHSLEEYGLMFFWKTR